MKKRDIVEKLSNDFCQAYVELVENGSNDKFPEVWITPIKTDKRCRNNKRMLHNKKVVIKLLRFNYNYNKILNYLKRTGV